MTGVSAVLSRIALGAAPAAIPAERGTIVSDETGRGASASVVFRGVSKVFRSPGGSVGALADIDAEVAAGRIFGIIGRSGAGKSTLLRLVNRLERPSSGQVLVDGEDVGRLDGEALIGLRRRVGMVFQHFNLLAAKTAWDNVALPLVVAGAPRREIERRVGEALALVGLEEKASHYPSRLSGGQKQRVGIARALVNRPRLLLCDEATSALDPEATLSILRLLADINRRLGLTIILITHEMAVVREICDDVLVLCEGRAVETGPVWQVFGEPAHPATQTLLRPDGRRLPPDLAARLAPTARPGRGDAALIELQFTGRTPPDLTCLAASQGIAIRLLEGALDRIGGHTQGRLLVSVPLGADGRTPDLTRFADRTELLGYVADDD